MLYEVITEAGKLTFLKAANAEEQLIGGRNAGEARAFMGFHHIQGRFRKGEAVAQRQAAAHAEMGMEQRGTRITSYNVCYTKLLRSFAATFPSARTCPAGSIRRSPPRSSVITSYSIHYTKLYDLLYFNGPDIRADVMGICSEDSVRDFKKKKRRETHSSGSDHRAFRVYRDAIPPGIIWSIARRIFKGESLERFAEFRFLASLRRITSYNVCYTKLLR